MIWSSSRKEIRTIKDNADRFGGLLENTELRQTLLLHTELDVPRALYYPAKKSDDRTYLPVKAFALMTEAGTLDTQETPVFVVATPASWDRLAYGKKIRNIFYEAHATAEAIALTSLFTRGHRRDAELAVVASLPKHLQKPFAEERIRQCGMLLTEVAGVERDYGDFGSQALLSHELSVAVDSLTSFLPNRPRS